MKTIAIDFDGTISEYKEYKGKGIFGEPVSGAKEAIKKLKDSGWSIIIYTTRAESNQIREYLNSHDIPFDYINHNPYNIENDCFHGKPKADVYLDDRAITFTGDWKKTTHDIENFEEWWKREANSNNINFRYMD